MKYKVPFIDPRKNYSMLKNELDNAYFEVMSNADLIMRKHLSGFEDDLARFVGTKYAVGLNSGYHALLVSLIACGIGDGDEVIVPAHTFLATASAVVNCGAKPVLVDVGKDYNIDVSKIEAAVSSRTKAIIPVHLNGHSADMDAVMRIAEKHSLKVIEDACQSLGATFNGKRAGSFGDTGCWSFYPFKILGGYGDGGAITTNDEEIARTARFLRYNGEDRETDEYHFHGYTCLLDNLQAAFLEVKLRKLPEWIEYRRNVAGMYKEGLSGTGDLELPHYDDPRCADVFQNYVIRTGYRDQLADHLAANGVEILIHWRKPYYRHKGLKFEKVDYPETDSISAQVISLPMNVEISPEQVNYVIETVRNFFEEVKAGSSGVNCDAVKR
ncbi:DegT/DnrJ/EryC1/StrS family aminotransferase [Candidatus Auribacterota bacterium]